MTTTLSAPRPTSPPVAPPAAVASRPTVRPHTATQIPPPPRYAPGQTVVFVNDYGVNWGERVIVDRRYDAVRGNVYHITPTDAPWFEDSERNLFVPGDPAIAAAVAIRRAFLRQDPFPWA